MNKKNEISIKIKVEKKDINENIYFLYGISKSGFTNYKENGAFSSVCSLIDLNKKVKEINESNEEIFITIKKM